MGHFRKPLLKYLKEKEKRGSRIKKSQMDGFVTWFFVIVILLAVALFILVLNNAWKKINPHIESSLNSSMPSSDGFNLSKVLDQTGNSITSFDNLLPFLIIGLFAFVMIVAGSIMKHPIMIFVGIIILGVVILLAVVYSNLYQDISTSDTFTDSASDLGIQNKFMEYLPSIVLLVGIGIAAAILWRDKNVNW